MWSGHANGAYKPALGLGDGSVYESHYPTNSGDILTLNEWVHLVITYDFSTHTATFYRNGESVPSSVETNGNVTNLTNTYPLKIMAGIVPR